MKSINRRDFLKILGAGTGALALNGFIPRFFVSPAHAALSDKKVVQIFLNGGSDFMTTCIPEKLNQVH